jgi:hypothetical protein
VIDVPAGRTAAAGAVEDAVCPSGKSSETGEWLPAWLADVAMEEFASFEACFEALLHPFSQVKNKSNAAPVRVRLDIKKIPSIHQYASRLPFINTHIL